MKMLDSREIILLEILKNSKNPVTSSGLALQTGVTSRTIKDDMKHLSQVLRENGAELLAKPGTGYCLQIHDSNMFSKLENRLKFHSTEQYQHIPQNRIQRINYMIAKLLSVDYSIDMDDFAQEIYVEKSTLNTCVREVNDILGRFQLQARYNRHNSIILQGDEIHRRLCIAEFFFHNHLNDSLYAEDNWMFSTNSSKGEIRRIRKALLRVLREFEIQISTASVENLSIHILIALRRWMLFDYVYVDENTVEMLRNTRELEAGKRLVNELSKEFEIFLPVSEAVYFALHLKSKRINVEPKETKEQYLKTSVADAVGIALEEIRNRYGLDFREDTMTADYLRLHISAMLERLKIGFPLRNSCLYEIRQESFLADRLTSIVAGVIEKIYGIPIDDNEEGFLTVYLNLALSWLRMRHGIRIAVTNSNGRPEGIMMMSKIVNARRGIPDKINFLDGNELEDLDESQYDLICSSTPLSQIKSLPIWICGSSEPIHADHLQRFIDSFQAGHVTLQQLFPEENFITIRSLTVAEFLQKADKIMSQQGFKDTGFYTLTALEKNCALMMTEAQPDRCMLRVFYIKNRLFFHQQSIQLVLWADAPKEECAILNLLLDVMSRWFRSPNMVANFWQKPCYRFLFHQLKQFYG